jgi:hypothetical protein
MEATKDEFNIPDIIVDPRTRTQYAKGKFLGKVRMCAKDVCSFDSDSCSSGRFREML